MIDTHAHLDACGEVESTLARARAAGVARVLTIGTGIESARHARDLARTHEGVFAAVGVDPHQAHADGARLDELRPVLEDDRVVAVGETGLDYFHRAASPERQRAVFAAQLELAEELGKPVVVHTRDADDDTAAALARFGGTVVLHCFSQPGLLPDALERGYYVSFAGNVTYPKAAELREAAARVPPDRLLAETDAPYLAPQPKRGQPNEPAYVMETLAVLAAARGDDPAELERQIEANAAAAFALP